MQNIQTLHAHTKNSDGELSHLEVLDVCEQNNIAVVAFTDHDSLIDGNSLKKLRAYKGKTKWISGIEISSGKPKELGGGAASLLHIVGLFVDPTNKTLKKHCKLAQEARVTRMQKMVENLQGLGFDITEEDCLEASGGEAVGRPHVVAALVLKEKNNRRIEELRQKMETESKTDKIIKGKYDAMMELGEGQYPYTLLFSNDAYIPNIYVDYQYFVDMDDSVKLIREAGGVAMLAHYFTCVKIIDKDMLEGMFVENRLDGAETTYGLFGLNKGTEIEKIIIETSNIVKGLVEKHNKLKGGGVDAHDLQRFLDFANSGEYADETTGFAEQIIERSNVDTKWSNF